MGRESHVGSTLNFLHVCMQEAGVYTYVHMCDDIMAHMWESEGNLGQSVLYTMLLLQCEWDLGGSHGG